ncbi:MAG: UDP-N-acetylmuramoyl-tripeptide--D-alanyl-D-alanine ligase [Planctomycetota bacterium]|jgi:UDP-N-acetylmuramoyl-tripeptide--D-alanyl-D-alanine ligase
MKLSLEQCAQWCGGRLVGDPSIVVSGVAADSRLAQPGNLFVGIKGPNFDGNEYVVPARENGAVASMVESEAALKGGSGVVVENGIHALGRLAQAFRNSLDIPWVGITGSNGKTTTRELLACLLKSKGPVAVSTRNYNNNIGVPLSILNAPDEAWAGVIEVGTSAPGEIAALCEILSPTTGVVTSVGRAHLEGFGDSEAVGHEKSAILKALPEDGLAVYPSTCSSVEVLRQASGCRTLEYAVGEDAELTAEQVTVDSAGIHFFAWETQFNLPLLGEHNIGNALAAIAVADTLGVTPAESAEALESFHAVAGRLAIHEFGSIRVIDDTYNANPESLNAAIETLVTLEGTRKVAIVGSMLELGPDAEQLHRECGHMMARTGIDVVIAVGKETVSMAEAAASSSAGIRVNYFPSATAAFPKLSSLIHPDDLVLVKGSRGSRMERLVGRLERLGHQNAFAMSAGGGHA